MFLDDNTPSMSTDEFTEIRNLIYDYCGLFFEEDKLYLLRKRLSRRLLHHQFNKFQDYFLFLKYDPRADEEMMVITDLLTTNETYFFREAYQLRAFTDEILPEITEKKKAAGDKTLRIWSAGCSTGEEPYTIAILIHEHLARLGIEGWDIEILGSDISQRVLSVARRGVYHSSSFREVDDKYLSYFEEVDNEKKKVSEEIHSMVSFVHLNLIDHNKIELLRTMDIIFCRNVIIYFDNAAKKKVVENFHKMLAPEGYLLLGHSESLMNITTLFSLKHLKNDMVYQRPSGENPSEEELHVKNKESQNPDTSPTNQSSGIEWSGVWKK
jgi:chemotaxis protein methyltransferase CheR